MDLPYSLPEGYPWIADEIERRDARIAELESLLAMAQDVNKRQDIDHTAQRRRIGELEEAVDERDELVRDLWPRARFTMTRENCEGWFERMRDIGIDLEGMR